MTELNTQLPTSGMLCGKSKWEVRKTMLPGIWAVSGNTVRYFSTWREAQDYADQRARTREYVLPRKPLPLTLMGLGDDATVTVNQDKEHGCVFLTDGGDGEIIVLYPQELRPLALALLALAEQEAHQ